LGWQPTTSRAGELWPWTRRGGGPAGSGQPAAMAGGERWLGHEEVARDPLEVGEGLAGAHPGLSTVAEPEPRGMPAGDRLGGCWHQGWGQGPS
jgi:hypothetical protein